MRTTGWGWGRTPEGPWCRPSLQGASWKGGPSGGSQPLPRSPSLACGLVPMAKDAWCAHWPTLGSGVKQLSVQLLLPLPGSRGSGAELREQPGLGTEPR